MRKAIASAAVLLLSVLPLTPSQSCNETGDDDYQLAPVWPRKVLPANYLKEIRPPTLGKTPVVVDFNIFVVDINSINVEDMDFRVDMFIYQTWTESRLEMQKEPDIFEDDEDYITLPPEFFDNLWQPDPYFLNSKVSEIAMLNSKHSSVTLYRNKTVRYAARMHAIIACQMEFQFYPMDIQICPMHIESFSYDSDKVKLQWGPAGVMVNPELKLLQYNLENPLKSDETISFVSEKNGNFSRLVVFFQFERQIGHHLIQTFAPSTLVVMLSWFSFWLGVDAIPGRISLLVTSMLTLVTMFTGLKTDIPPVAYVKALDLWMAGCMFFVFSALGEFVVVKVLDLEFQRECEASNSYRRLPARLSVVEKVSIWDYESSVYPKSLSKRAGSRNPLQNAWIDPEVLIRRPKNRAKKIDTYSRVVFPVLFLVFSVLYWPVLFLRQA